MATPLPPNRAAFTVAEILEATSGKLVTAGAEAITGIFTDSRLLGPGACFVALHGEVHDGHTHLAAAAVAGAAAVVVDRDVAAPPGLAVIRVRDTLVALGDLARAHARRWRSTNPHGRTIAITGSAGKTTTRVALTALFAELALHPESIHGARGNLNNRVGVPLVLLGLEDHHEMVILEMGMNQPGEIAELCRIAEPDVGVVTLIAAAHTEGLGSIEAVADEKIALFEALPEHGLAVGNGDDERVRDRLNDSPAQLTLLYGRYAHDERVARRILAREPVGMNLSRVRVSDFSVPRESIEFTTPLLGEAGALACTAAMLVSDIVFGTHLDGATCTRAFARADVGAGAGRLAPRLLPGDVAVIDDSYNANPASACASIRAATEIAQAAGRRLLLVLGEMRELGALAADGHDEVGRAAAGSGAAEVFAVGGGEAPRIAARAAEGGLRAGHTARVEDVIPQVRAAVRPGDLLLVKGSRSTGTERVVAALASSSPSAPTTETVIAGGAS